jgi:hypothetical protein
VIPDESRSKERRMLVQLELGLLIEKRQAFCGLKFVKLANPG